MRTLMTMEMRARDMRARVEEVSLRQPVWRLQRYAVERHNAAHGGAQQAFAFARLGHQIFFWQTEREVGQLGG